MALNLTLGTLAGLSCLLLLWQWFAASRFPLHRRGPATLPDPSPGVTLLKPIKGMDEHTGECLRSWFTQDYPGEMQILFGVDTADDPACALIRRLIAEYPQRTARLVVCGESLGPNGKISKLAQLEPSIQHEIIVSSDADVWAPADALKTAVAMIASGRESPHGPARPAASVGLITFFYREASPATTALRWEAVATNADFWSQVLQSRMLKPLDFALGAVMVTHRARLTEIGGFRALADCLADDYELGHRIAQQGHRIELCPVVVECRSGPMTWRAVWRHQLRWARTIRACQPLPYFFSILSNATLWPLLWLAAVPRPATMAAVAGCLGLRLLIATCLQKRLAPGEPAWRNAWLVPVKDVLHALLWVGAFTGNQIEWRGERFRLRRDGTLEKQ